MRYAIGMLGVGIFVVSSMRGDMVGLIASAVMILASIQHD